MKKPLILFLLASAMVVSSCRRDDDDDTTQLTGLAAFLNGEFEVTRADYNGYLQTPLSNIPMIGTGTGTVGTYNFKAASNKVDYQVSSNMEIEIPVIGQIPVPINVDGSGNISYTSSTQFVIDDPTYGPMTYNISDKTSNSLVATTRYVNDTTLGTVDLLLDIYLEKK